VSTKSKPSHTCLATTETVKHYVEKLEEDGCEVSHRQPECYQVVDDGTVVYQAFQEGTAVRGSFSVATVVALPGSNLRITRSSLLMFHTPRN
jgi:hypothetical protein